MSKIIVKCLSANFQCTTVKADVSFVFAVIYKIVDKEEGTVIPFVLNYPQRKLLEKQEEMRLARRPIRIIMPKARQFGGSTETQLYGKWIQDFKHTRWNMAIMAQKHLFFISPKDYSLHRSQPA